MGLPSGQVLQPNEYKRVRSLLSRYPDRIWAECKRWLNVEGQLVSVSNIEYAISMQSLLPWKHLFTEIKQKTADFQMLRADVRERPPFSQTLDLADSIEERLEREPETVCPQDKPWLTSLGQGLSGMILEDPTETMRIRRLADRLVRTRFQFTPDLETVPYVAGVQVGTARRADALWSGFMLYVAHQSAGRVAAPVAQEIGRVFDRREIKDACLMCYERTADFVDDYLESNFKLAKPETLEPGLGEWDSLQDVEKTDVGSPPGDRTETNAAGPDAAPLPRPPQEPIVGKSDEPEIHELVNETNEDSGKQTVPAPTKPRPPAPKPIPGLIEWFALTNGFSSDGPDRFCHSDGRWMQKVKDAVFPWELYSRSGEIVRRYWPRDCCLETAPVELDSEVWTLCERQPDIHSLILANPSGAPTEISGARLMQMRDSGRLTLHAARYRISLKYANG